MNNEANATTVAQPSKQNKKAASVSAPESQASIASEAQSIAERVKAEVNAIVDARRAYVEALTKTGSMGLDSLADAVGLSVNETGRPALAPWQTFTLACALQKVSHATFDRLCRIALKAVGQGEATLSGEKLEKARKLFIKSKCKGNVGKSSATLTMNTPAAWDIALGE